MGEKLRCPRPGDKKRRGQIVILIALAAPVLFAIMGLALDGGLLYQTKRRMQAAADAGALGGAHELWRGNSALVVAAAVTDVAQNGFNNTNATVTVNNPPLSGTRAGDPNFVEVIISRNVPTYFMRILSSEFTTVRARAVAGLVRYVENCVLALDPSASGALRTNGNPTLVANCGVMVNSSSSNALTAVGNSSITATEIGVAGGYSGSAGSFNPAPITGVPPALDPLWWLQAPNYSGWPAGSYNGATRTYTCPGGTCVYSSQITINNGDVTFEPGIYILVRGMKITGGNVTGTGVAFYNVNASGKDHIDVGGNGVVRLSAPGSGPMKGILFFGNRNSPDRPPGNKIGRGTSDSFFEGAIYFPSQHVDWAGNSQASAWTMIIAKTINISGTSDVQQVSKPPIGEGPDVVKATIVE